MLVKDLVSIIRDTIVELKFKRTVNCGGGEYKLSDSKVWLVELDKNGETYITIKYESIEDIGEKILNKKVIGFKKIGLYGKRRYEQSLDMYNGLIEIEIKGDE